MKLSEAIRLGSMAKPQAFWTLSDGGRATCALGAAADAIGILDHSTGQWTGKAPQEWRPVAMCAADCPECGADFELCGKFTRREVQAVIVHLNNIHRWTRERIADWVESIERAQAPSESSVEVGTSVDAVVAPGELAELTPVHARA